MKVIKEGHGYRGEEGQFVGVYRCTGCEAHIELEYFDILNAYERFHGRDGNLYVRLRGETPCCGQSCQLDLVKIGELADDAPTVDDLIRECGARRWVYVLKNHGTLTTAEGQPINEATVMARGRQFMSRDADPAKALNAAMNGLARVLEVER